MNSENPSNIYYDLNLKYYDTSDNKTSIPLHFVDSRQDNYVPDISKYDLSIVRFSISSSNLPVHIIEIQPNQPNIDLTIHTITMQIQRGGVGSTLYTTGPFSVFFEPEDLNASLPIAPSSNPNLSNIQDIYSNYYHIYSYQHLMKIINNTFATITASLVGFDPYFAGLVPPTMYWDTNTNKAEIYVRQNCYQTDRTISDSDKDVYISIFFNKSLYNLFSTFYYIQQRFNQIDTYTGQTYGELGMHYQLICNADNELNVLQTSNLQPLNRYLKITQFQSTIMNINSVNSIIFTSNSIPVISSLYNKPHVILNNQQLSLSSNGFSDIKLNILTDFSPSDIVVRSGLYYVPNEYRYISLTNSKQALRQIDINVYWIDTFGCLHAYQLLSGGNASLKIMFRRKY